MRVVLSAFLWLAICFGTTCASDPSLGDVLRAFEQRQQSIRTAHFRWSGKWTTAERFLPGIKTGRDPDARDSTFPYSAALLFEGYKPDRLRFSGNKPIRNSETGLVDHVKSDYAWDGQSCKRLRRYDESNLPLGDLIVRKRTQHTQDLHLKSILMHFRPLVADMGGFDREQLQLTSRRATANGQTCMVVTVRGPGPGDNAPPLREFWVDPSRSFVIVRYVLKYASGQTKYQIDTEFTEDANFGWVPTKWRNVAMSGDGSLEYAYADEVTGYELNTTFADKHFKLDFPTGTLVRDFRTPHRRYWLVESGDKTRYLDRTAATRLYYSRASAIFPETAREVEAELGRPASGANLRWMFYLAGAVVFLCIGVVLYRRYRIW